MSAASDEPLDDGPNSTVPAESKRREPDVTLGDTQVTPDPGATVDSARKSADAAAKSEAASSDEDSALGATVIPGGDASGGNVSVTVMSDWEATLDADVEPGHTIKAPAVVPKKKRGSFEQTIALKRREVTQGGGEGTAESAEVADADYQIEELLGEGGMGAVYAARQRSMDRPVAIKVLKSRAARLESSQDAFVSEAVITGKLDHPNIVPIYDVGKQPNDALFYAMKQVEGVEWKERFAENTVSENLDVLLRVSDAIAFAHARGIIHRDLKPANIMLGPFGEVLVMDWGLAMPTEDHPSRETFPEARAGGTPHYMAPEMADGTERVDRRSDVYLLGAMLFEIVTGKPPHALDIPKGNRRTRVLAVLDAVANNVIVSTDETGELLDIARKAIATDPADRYQTVPDFQAALREYLTHEESIELADRAAERLAAGRQSGEYTEFSRARFGFETALEQWSENKRAAEGLREACFDYAKTAFDRGDLDLALSLIDESDSKQKELGALIRQAIVDRDARQQQLRRLRRISLVASLVVAIVSIGAAVWINSERGKALVAQQEEAAQREIAERNEQEAQQQRQLAESERKQAELEREKAVVAQQEEAAQRAKATAAEADAKREANNALKNLRVAEQNAYYSDMMLVSSRWKGSGGRGVNELLEKYRDRVDLRGFEWRYWNRLVRSDLLTLKGHTNGVLCVSFSPDGTRLAAGGWDGTARLWDAATGQETLTLKGQAGGVLCVSFSPDGTRLATGSHDGTAKLWDVATGKETLTLKGHTTSVSSVSFSPDGTRLATGSHDGTAKLWDVATGQETLTLKGHTTLVESVTFSADGTRLATGSRDMSVILWDAVDGKETLTLKGHTGAVWCVSFSLDGTRLATGSQDGTAKLWDAATGEETLTLKGHISPVKSVTFSADGTRLATGSRDMSVILWDAATGEEAFTLKGHTHTVESVSFSPDGTRLATGSLDTIVKLWDVAVGQETPTLKGHASGVPGVSFSPDGTRLATASFDKTVRVWDVATGQETLTLKGHTSRVDSVSFSPHGTQLATGSFDGTAKLWDAATGQETFTLKGHASGVNSVSFNQDGTRLATCSQDGTVKLWDAATGQETLTLKGHASGVNSVSFNPDGTRLAIATQNIVRLCNASTGEETLTLQGHSSFVQTVTFNIDGTRLATGCRDGTAKVWDIATGQEVLTLQGHAQFINSVAFSPDTTRLATGSFDKTVKLWDLATGQETLAFEENTSGVLSVAFSPDGTQLAAGYFDKTVKIWDTIDGVAYRRQQRELPASERSKAATFTHRASEAEKTKDWYAAAWNLNQLIALAPDDASLQERRALAEAKLREKGLLVPDLIQTSSQ